MTRDEVIRMAEESGLVPVDQVGWATCYQGSREDLQRFAELVAAAEREACAKVATNACLVPPDGGSPTDDERLVCEETARRIRARGQQ